MRENRGKDGQQQSTHSNDFSEETKRGNGSPWNGVRSDTKPARREVDYGKLSPSPIKQRETK